MTTWRKCFAIIGLLGLTAAALPSRSEAAGNYNAKIILHALSPTTKNQCVRAANFPASCLGYNGGVNNLGLYPTSYHTYLLVVDGSQTEGIAGVQCGISYNPAPGEGVDVYTWNLCATLEFSSTGWPASGGGNLITWDATTRCQTSGNALTGAVAVAGYFYMAAYTPDLMKVTPRPVDGLGKVANCGSVEDIINSCPLNDGFFYGAAGFGRSGHNPCGFSCPLPVEAKTWSGVKVLSR
ncbi:MAG TPA: hypothetical protein VF720_16220 [Candidatus Eisenbacteria bacterium]